MRLINGHIFKTTDQLKCLMGGVSLIRKILIKLLIYFSFNKKYPKFRFNQVWAGIVSLCSNLLDNEKNVKFTIIYNLLIH